MLVNPNTATSLQRSIVVIIIIIIIMITKMLINPNTAPSLQRSTPTPPSHPLTGCHQCCHRQHNHRPCHQHDQHRPLQNLQDTRSIFNFQVVKEKEISPKLDDPPPQYEEVWTVNVSWINLYFLYFWLFHITSSHTSKSHFNLLCSSKMLSIYAKTYIFLFDWSLCGIPFKKLH